MKNVYRAPESLTGRSYSLPCIFLAGTIDNGRAEDWQSAVAYELSDQFVVLNPRREKWDPHMEQSIDNDEFVRQVEWELDGMDHADYIIMNFLKDSKSPVTMFELGYYAETGKLLVVCPEGFWRKGNVDIICHRLGINQFDTVEEAVQYLKELSDEDLIFGEGEDHIF